MATYPGASCYYEDKDDVSMPFRIAYADITQIKADAIVNPTDQYYSGGGGVDRQIHEICGYKLYEATDRLPRLHLGEAKATPGFALPCKYIIHTSGPRWRDSHFLEISLLGSCYRNSIQLAHSLGCRSIAFPLVSSRGKHFPKEQALTTAIDAIMESTSEYPDMEVILTIYGKWTENIPEDYFNWLSEYIEETYEPESEQDLSFEDSYESAGIQMLCCKEAASESPIIDSSLIINLLNKPTQPNLDKIPVDESFDKMLNRLIDENQTKTNDILDQIGISGAGLSKLRNGKNNPSKLTVFALAVFFKLSIDDTTDMLMKAGYAINPSSMQDIIISGLIREGIYDRYKIDDLLYALDLQPLPGAVIDETH